MAAGDLRRGETSREVPGRVRSLGSEVIGVRPRRSLGSEVIGVRPSFRGHCDPTLAPDPLWPLTPLAPSGPHDPLWPSDDH